MVRKLIAIAANTFLETTRQPIYGILMWVAAFWIGFVSPSLAAYSLHSGSDIKVMMDVSLATLMLYGLLASVFSAASVITREIESHTVLTVVAKPVARPVFLVGKYLGVTAAVLVGCLFLTMILFMAARHGTMETAADKWDLPVLIFGLGAIFISLVAATFGNYVYGWHFVTALTAWVVPLMGVALTLVLFISPEWQVQSPLTDFGDGQLLYAALTTFCGVLILSAFAVTLATRFSMVMTLLLCAGVFILGLLSDYYLGRPAQAGEGPLYELLYVVTPNFQYFWLGDPLTEEVPVPLRQVLLVAGYSGLYAMAVLALGIALFQTREVG